MLGLPYRHPATLAKSAETLARLSSDRLVLGLGTGGDDSEFAAFGLAVRTPREKVKALNEAVEVLHALWRHDTATTHGTHFAVSDAHLEPQPLYRPPVWVGGYGPRSLDLVGRLADGWLPSYARLGPDGTAAALTRIARAADEAGRSPDSIALATNVFLTPDHLSNADRLAAELTEVVEVGFGTLLLAGLDTSKDRTWFAERVAPRLRERATP